MKAVFLDRSTFSTDINLIVPNGITEWKVYDRTAPSEVIERLQDADIAITNKVVLDAYVIGQLPQLKLIQVTATGTNNIDFDAAKRHDIVVKNVAGYSIHSVAEHTIMMMLSVLRGLKNYHQSVADGSWQADGRFCLTEPTIIDLYDKTLGIIGVGNIGEKVTTLAKAFGMKVLWAERQGKTPRDDRYTDFETVLAESDILTLHCPLTEDTHHLVNATTIAKMHKKPLIINAARGAVVEPQAVAEAVQSGALFGFASDVFEQEPPTANDPLLSIANHPRVLYTPHVAWASANAQSRLWSILCDNISQFIKENTL